MKLFILAIAFFVGLPTAGHSQPSMEDLQGAWWSDSDSPTAEFGIRDQEVWLDFSSTYYPCRIDGDVLVFDLDEPLGEVRNRIIRLEGDELVLEHLKTGRRRVLYRDQPHRD